MTKEIEVGDVVAYNGPSMVYAGGSMRVKHGDTGIIAELGKHIHPDRSVTVKLFANPLEPVTLPRNFWVTLT